jgi:hypothetical protein
LLLEIGLRELPLIGFEPGFGRRTQIMLRKRRIRRPVAGKKSLNLTFIFFQQTDRIIFGMALKKYKSGLRITDRHVHAGFRARDQYVYIDPLHGQP